MSFDPEKVQLVEFCELCLNLYIEPRVSYADYEKLLQLYRDQTALLHDVSTDADPAGTLRELRLAQDTIKALEARIAELEEEIDGR